MKKITWDNTPNYMNGVFFAYHSLENRLNKGGTIQEIWHDLRGLRAWAERAEKKMAAETGSNIRSGVPGKP